MSKLRNLIVFLGLLAACNPGPPEKVYICGSSAAVYHARRKCKGLNNCSHRVNTIAWGDSVLVGKRECKVCF